MIEVKIKNGSGLGVYKTFILRDEFDILHYERSFVEKFKIVVCISYKKPIRLKTCFKYFKQRKEFLDVNEAIDFINKSKKLIKDDLYLYVSKHHSHDLSKLHQDPIFCIETENEFGFDVKHESIDDFKHLIVREKI